MMAAIQRVTAPLLFVCKWGKGRFGKTRDTFAPLACFPVVNTMLTALMDTHYSECIVIVLSTW